jgi:hypothetical protein
MNLIDFDLTGFVNFPHFTARSVKRIDSGKTYVYLVAFDGNEDRLIQELKPVGIFCGDDVSPKSNIYTPGKDIESLIKEISEYENDTREFYFHNNEPFKVNSQILLGWSKFTYEYTDRVDQWCCSFRELTNEGKKLYYSMKKLHNNSEIRILTFNNIK